MKSTKIIYSICAVTLTFGAIVYVIPGFAQGKPGPRGSAAPMMGAHQGGFLVTSQQSPILSQGPGHPLVISQQSPILSQGPGQPLVVSQQTLGPNILGQYQAPMMGPTGNPYMPGPYLRPIGPPMLVPTGYSHQIDPAMMGPIWYSQQPGDSSTQGYAW